MADVSKINVNGSIKNIKDSAARKVMTGASSSAAGAQGQVPAPAAGDNTKFLKGDGTWAAPIAATMTGASADAAGTSGSAPAPAAGDNTKYLRGDATWATPTDTKNTAGSTDSSSKLFLIGATSQGTNPQTYSHDTAYVGTDGCLYSGGSKVLTSHQDISGKMDANLKGAANGVAELDSSGKVPSSQLPSYVDDVLEYANLSSFPATGETGKIYIAKDTNKEYRWSGTAYVEISASLALGETSSTAYRGDRGKVAYDHASDANKLTTATSSGLYKVASTANGHIASLTAVQKSDITALGIPSENTTYSSKSAASGGTDVSLVTTGEKYTWNNKSDLTLGTSATTAAKGNHTHTTSLATDSGTSTVSLAANTKYKLTAGGNSVIFTTPPDNNTTYENKSAASGGTDVSLVTTGEKYTWNNKSNLTIGTTSTTAAAGNHTHTTSLASDTGTASVSLSANSTYKLTAGGTEVIFKTPADTNTKNTAGSTDTSSKIFLIGATSQAANPQTYSHDTAYVGTDGCLYSGGAKVLTSHQDISGKVSGPSSATDSHVAIYDGTTGKAIKDSGFTIGKSVPSDAVFTDTNNAVAQTATSTNANYEVLFSNTADNTTRTEAARKNSNLKFNPSTGNLQATQLNGVTIGSSPKFTDTTYSSKSAASGGSDVSLVTTGEKYTWNNKSNLALGTSATTAAKGNHTHTTSLATDTGNATITLAHNTTYKLTAGGTSVIFKTPPAVAASVSGTTLTIG